MVLRMAVEAEPADSTRKLAAEHGHTQSAVIHHLREIEKVKCAWLMVPRVFTLQQAPDA